MRNKKYRPVKLWLLLGGLLLIGVPSFCFFEPGWEKWLGLFSCAGLFFGLIICFTYWFEVKEDRIIIRHGLSSFNKKYISSFKTRTIMICDIQSMDLWDFGKAIVICLKDGNDIYFPIGGYFHHAEIVRLVYEVKKQIYM